MAKGDPTVAQQYFVLCETVKVCMLGPAGSVISWVAMASPSLFICFCLDRQAL